MKKKNANGERLFLLLFLIFALVIAGGLGVWKLNSEESDDKNDVNLKEENNGGADNNSNNNNDNNNSNENISNNNSNLTLVKEDVKLLKFGEVSKNLYSYYYVDSEDVLDNDETIKVFVLRREVFLDNKIIGETHMLGYYSTKEEALEAINNFSLGEYEVLTDNKNGSFYNLVKIDQLDNIVDGEVVYYASDSSITYIIDVNGNVLKSLHSKLAGISIIGVYANDSMINDKYYESINKTDERDYPEGYDYYLYPDDKLIDVRGGYLLYLIPSEDVCSYDEKKLIVENGVVNETILNVYLEETQVDLAGQSC